MRFVLSACAALLAGGFLLVGALLSGPTPTSALTATPSWTSTPTPTQVPGTTLVTFSLTNASGAAANSADVLIGRHSSSTTSPRTRQGARRPL